jgi:hypothetical protein
MSSTSGSLAKCRWYLAISCPVGGDGGKKTTKRELGSTTKNFPCLVLIVVTSKVGEKSFFDSFHLRIKQCCGTGTAGTVSF